MAALMRAALHEAAAAIGTLIDQIDQMKPASSNTDGSLRMALSSARDTRASILKLLAKKPKPKRRKLVT